MSDDATSTFFEPPAPYWEFQARTEEDDASETEVRRMRVPGGWLYRVETFEPTRRDAFGDVRYERAHVSMTFVPEP